MVKIRSKIRCDSGGTSHFGNWNRLKAVPRNLQFILMTKHRIEQSATWIEAAAKAVPT